MDLSEYKKWVGIVAIELLFTTGYIKWQLHILVSFTDFQASIHYKCNFWKLLGEESSYIINISIRTETWTNFCSEKEKKKKS